MEFEWDESKAESNWQKHGVSFPEAVTVFGDPLAITFFDLDHSDDEDRFITIGLSLNSRVIILSHTDRDDESGLLALERRLVLNAKDMKTEHTPEDELRPEYDLSKLKGGVRGKYLERYKSRLHVVRLSPEAAAAFPTEDAVNRALEMLAELAKQQANVAAQ